MNQRDNATKENVRNKKKQKSFAEDARVTLQVTPSRRKRHASNRNFIPFDSRCFNAFSYRQGTRERLRSVTRARSIFKRSLLTEFCWEFNFQWVAVVQSWTINIGARFYKPFYKKIKQGGCCRLTIWVYRLLPPKTSTTLKLRPSPHGKNWSCLSSTCSWIWRLLPGIRKRFC